MNGASLAKMFRVSHGALRMNLDGIHHQDNLVEPAPAGNRAHSVLAHIIASRDQMFPLLGAEPVLAEPSDGARYPGRPTSVEEMLLFVQRA